MIDPNINVVWQPIPNTSQEDALSCPCNHILYTGARGPGKTDTQVMRFRRYVGQGYGSFWRGVIFDRKYKNLDDLITKTKRWFYAFNDGVRFLESANAYKWVWPTGEELLFRQVIKDDDYWNYHGQEFPFIGWNELTKYPTGDLYDKLMSCNRSSYTPAKDGWIGGTRPKDGGPPVGPNGEIPGEIPLTVFSTTNPYGAGHTWVKRRFIDPAPYGQVIYQPSDVFNPRTQQKQTIVKTQVTLFGSYRENIYLSPEYIAELDKIKDPNLRKAWLYGSWDIVAGGALSDLWEKSIHEIPRFPIPSNWYIDRTFDWGSSHPFYVGWFALANGEEVTLQDGRTFCPPAGSLILIHELYGTKELGTNKGLMWSAPMIAEKINEIESELLQDRWIFQKPWSGPADNQIRDTRESDVETIEQKFLAKGVSWESSDKSPGSRRNGLELTRNRLEAARSNEGPGLYFMEHCRAAISILPALPRDEKKPDDVDTDAEDHPYDALRYRVLKGTIRTAQYVPVKIAS